MGIRGEIFTLGTLLYVDSLYVGFRTWKSQERGKKWRAVIADMWGQGGGGNLTPETLLSIESLY